MDGVVAHAGAQPIKLAADPDHHPSSAVPLVDHAKIASKNRLPKQPLSPLMQQSIATLVVVGVLLLVFCQIRCYFSRRQHALLSQLPEACPDGTWLVVAYEWDQGKVSSGRMPLDGIASIADLVAAAVDFGAEAVDADIREDNIDVKYMDQQGVERRVGAKTRFDDVQCARLLRITRRQGSARMMPKDQESLLLMPSSHIDQPAPVNSDEFDHDDISTADEAAAMLQPDTSVRNHNSALASSENRLHDHADACPQVCNSNTQL